ncbi:hypothetical protein A9993_10580 [Rahnella victoriana]|uniref:hypothetical protein n=1 Tax=Rahnella victoriana TaxID=1510570 RepID=UPI000BB1CC28|nr:hypothetical protein [Rahnella victoriana]PBI80150.1 hypothetical protein A9993_10580 [Rahnella victoriana]
MTLHEKVVAETMTTMNAAFVQLNVPLIIRRIRRSDIIWQQRRARRNLRQPEKNLLNWKWLFKQYRKNQPRESGMEQTAYVFCLNNPHQERAAFLMESCTPPTGSLEINALENFYRKTAGHPLKRKMLYYSLCVTVIYADTLNDFKILNKEDARFLIKDVVNDDVMRFYISSAPLSRVPGKMECESTYHLLREYMTSGVLGRGL